jgi:hypothetical protein
MRLGTLMMVTTVVAGIFGIAFVLASGPLMSMYGATLNPAGTLIAQLFGAALIGYAVVNWFARNAKGDEALRAIVLANFVADTIGFIVSLLGQLSGAVNALGWSTVVIYLLLALGFAYFHFMKPSAS